MLSCCFSSNSQLGMVGISWRIFLGHHLTCASALSCVVCLFLVVSCHKCFGILDVFLLLCQIYFFLVIFYCFILGFIFSWYMQIFMSVSHWLFRSTYFCMYYKPLCVGAHCKGMITVVVVCKESLYLFVLFVDWK